MLGIGRWLAAVGAIGLTSYGASSGSPPSAPAEGQSYRQAIELMCQVDRRAGISPDSGPIEIEARRAEWIADHVEHPDAIELRTRITVEAPGEQAKMLREQADSAGIRDCPLADTWQAEAANE